VAAFLALVPAASGATQIATCERGPVADGSGPADWRRESLIAGPLSVFRRPLSQMSETNSGQLIAKMPVLTAAGAAVTLSVPPRQRHRVFLYYAAWRTAMASPQP